MPRQPAVSHKVILQHLLDADIFLPSGKLKMYNDPIWISLCTKIRTNMLPTSLYLYVYKNTEKCKFKIMEHKKMKFYKVKSTKKSFDPDFEIYKLKNPHKKSALNFRIMLNKEEWLKIAPEYSNKQKKLKRGWTNLIYQKIFSTKGLRCSYKFPNLSVTGSIDDFNISFNGECTECHTGISGELIKIEDEQRNVAYGFDLKTFSVQKLYHQKKRNLAFDDREKAQAILENKFASDYKEDVQNELMLDNSYEPANLHSVTTYEKARQQIRNKKLGYVPSMKLTDISVIKQANIRKLCLEPFHVIYWLDKQVTLWNKICDMNLPLSLDATGGLFKSNVFKGIKSHSLLYYVMVVGIENTIVPIMQFITAAHHVPAIQEALSVWLEKSGARKPKSISTDGSGALQNAITLEFNNLTFAEYNLVCYQFLTGLNVELPACVYKSDRAHLLRTLNTWTCFVGHEPDVLSFYKRCVAYMTKIKNIQEFEQIALALLTVSQSQVVPEGSKCEKELMFLESVIKTHKCITLQETELEIEGDQKMYPEPKQLNVQNDLTKFVNKIFEEAKSNAAVYDKFNKHPPNPYCVTEFRKNFKTLCNKFPSWTAVMMEVYGLDGELVNSARSETYFRKKKAQVPRPINIVKFLLYDNLKIESYVNKDYVSVRFRENSTTNSETSCEANLFDLPLEA